MALASSAPILTEMEMKHQTIEEEIIDIPLLLQTSSRSEGSNSKSRIYTEWSDCCIYRVPKHLRSLNEAAYTPQLVSVGPFHHGKPELRSMEIVKSRYLEEFCNRTGKTSEDLRNIIDDSFEKRVRACYAGTFDLKLVSNFVVMILVDACFIIELLLRSWEENEKDYILGKPWLRKRVELDLILLENQIPFFVLEEIYNYTQAWAHISSTTDSHANENFSAKGKEDQVFETLPNCFCLCNKEEDEENKGGKEWLRSKNRYSNCHSSLKASHLTFLHMTRHYFSTHHFKYEGYICEVKHITDLLRCYLCPPGQGRPNFQQRDGRNVCLRTATLLDQAGIEFEVVENTYLNNITFKKGKLLRYFPYFNCSWLLKCLPCLFESFPVLKFQQPTLKLPEIEVDDSTECVFRNLMALEQCHYPKEAYICNYVWLMDKLINTRDDVDLLIEKKVIVNMLGSSKELADLFNTLSRRIVETNSCYYSCVQEINHHCKNPLNRIMATFTSVYFRDFWRGTASIVGVIVMVLTVWTFVTRILK